MRCQVRNDGFAQIANIAFAIRLPSLLPGRIDSWQQHGSQNPNDGNDHQQFDKRKTRLAVRYHEILPLNGTDEPRVEALLQAAQPTNRSTRLETYDSPVQLNQETVDNTNETGYRL